MSDGSLSQDEIDALLQGGDIGSAPAAPAAGGSQGLSDQEIADFRNLIGELLPSQAQNLSNMVGDTVEMTQPDVAVVSRDELVGALPGNVVEIRLNFQDQISGDHSYIIGPEPAITIAGLMMGQEEVELNEAALSAIEEAANTLAGTAATVFGDKSGKSAMTTPADTKNVSSAEMSFSDSSLVKVSYQTKIDGKEPTAFIEAFSIDLVKSIVGAAPAEQVNGMDSMAGMDLGSLGGAPAGGQPAVDPMAAMAGMGSMGGQPAMGGAMNGMDMFGTGQPTPNVQGLQFPSLNPQAVAGEQGNIGLLMDVYMEMTVELGRTKKLIKEILGMGEGTIIELDKLAGEPVDILVNHKLIAKGEVVVIDENFGVRVTEIVSPIDRVDSLG
ncbi:MAG: flagellar motor switch phosphatase FliY [Spirochaetales bacterium]|uniref:Flagellar motor switch protein FliN n=1 Tax=Candidatus Thalassospirochaeta sargassi TaxID=3119039 RepID=A0AAJ1IFX2_9SPIO|nr:flagellar motor switch phosphatase FliY [Spirochaetales bacterium]